MHVSILAYDGCLGFEIFGLADVLLIANRISGAGPNRRPPPFTVEIVGVEAGTVELAGGARLAVARPPVSTDLLVVPAFDFGNARELDGILARLAPEIDFVRRSAARHPVASICGGGFLLAAAGLLDGRRATTAWAFAVELARRFPDVKVEADALLVRDGDILTSGAVSACTDLAIRIVREQAGPGLARAVCRLGLLDSGRSSQAPYFDTRFTGREHERFSHRVVRWLELRMAEPYSLERLARAFNLSTRTLLRRFKAETGCTPLRHLQESRIAQAKRLLEESGLGLVEIAERVGYRDLSTFSRLFARETSVTPAAYRKRFRPSDRAREPIN